MTSPLNHDAAKGWLALLLDITAKATPITLLFAVVVFAALSYYMVRELQRVRAMNTVLWERVVAAEKGHLELALRCVGREERP